MGHIQGQSRHQVTLFPEVLDDLVPADHVVRVVDAFVDQLDLRALGFCKVDAAATGRPPYHPGVLLKLYVYGYMKRIRSSRCLEDECRSNVAFMWLLGRLCPDFKTIANFRKDNRGGLVGVCRSFVRFCREESLFSAELLAIDGSKFRAVSGKRGVYTRGRVLDDLARIDKRIGEYLGVLDAVDQQECSVSSKVGRGVSGILSALSRRRRELQAAAVEMEERGSSHCVPGEPDARLMRQSGGGHEVSYNVQTAVDEKHKLIVSYEVTTAGNDHAQLYPMARAAQAALGVRRLDVVADAGYQNAQQGQACEAAGMRVAVPGHRLVNPRGDFFERSRFTYDKRRDSYICPAGEELELYRVNTKNKTRYYSTKACAGCSLRPRCTGGHRRTICRNFYADAQERMNRRAQRRPEWMRKRGCLSEHPFGNIKRMMGDGRFLMRGLENVRAEMGLSVLSYNLRRVSNILGVELLCARLSG